MYTAIYRDFRPDNFDQLVGQEHIVKILKNQIASGRTGHAYLFCGTRGTGKTTSARILAKALNCEGQGEKPCGQCDNCLAIKEGTFMDVIEIDAASNNGVDNIRELRESVKYPPVKGRNKVYIIDEVHMLSSGAFNALLKTLEEPPEHVVFILATTEPQKLPATILSRCMRLDFRRVSERVIIQNMRMICDARGIYAEDGALKLIAVNADGSVRDSLSILEQCISTGNSVTRDDVAELLGTAGEDIMISLTDCVMKADIPQALILLDNAINAGRDVKQFMKEWLTHFRNLLMAKYIDDPENALNMSLENAERVKIQSQEISTDMLNRGITELTKAISDSRWSTQPRVILEMCIVRLGVGQEIEKALVFQYDGKMSGFVPGSISVKQQAENSNTSITYADTAKAKGDVSPTSESNTSQINIHETGASDVPPWEDIPMEVLDAMTNNTLPEFFGDLSISATDVVSGKKNDEKKAEDNLAKKDVENAVLEELWSKVVTKSIGERPMLIRLKDKTTLTRIDEKNFYISAKDSMTERVMMEKGKSILEEKFEMYHGKKLSLVLEKRGAATISKASPEDELAKSISDRFNIKVEVKNPE